MKAIEDIDVMCVHRRKTTIRLINFVATSVHVIGLFSQQLITREHSHKILTISYPSKASIVKL